MSSAPPVVSVVIAAHDAAATIDAAIASAQAQTLREIEIIVVDDASRDDTPARVEARAGLDPRVQLVASTRNGGPGRARNAGLARARGAWVAVLDADDAFAPDRLVRLLALADGGAEMVADNLRLEGPEGSSLLLPAAGDPVFAIEAEAFVEANRGRREQGRVLYGFLKPMIRRSFLERHSIRYRALRLAEDYFLALECLLHGARWLVTRDALYRYAVREGSLTAGLAPSHLDAMAEADAALLDLPALRSQPGLRRAIADHRGDVRRAATWTRFVEAVRRRDLTAAGALLVSDAAAARHVLGEGAAAAPRVLARLARARLAGGAAR